MLKQIIEFVEKIPESQWGEVRLTKYLEKRKFFIAVNTSEDLEYSGFKIIGIENPFPDEKKLSSKYVTLESWMAKNKELLKYTEFTSYRQPANHNSCLGSTSGLGTICLSHFQLEMGKKITDLTDFLEDPHKKQKNTGETRNDLLEILAAKIKVHVKAAEKILPAGVEAEQMKKLYFDFFKDLFETTDNQLLKKVFKHEVLIQNESILGIKVEDNTVTSKPPKYFNVQKADKKPFIKTSRTRPTKENLLISTKDQDAIHKFMIKILPDTGPTFILPTDEKLQEKIAKNLAHNEKNFFKTIESLLAEIEKNHVGKKNHFDFYLADIRAGEINFFDYVSNYPYWFDEKFCEVFPLGHETIEIEFNRRNLTEHFSDLFGQERLNCLPWVDPPKGIKNSKIKNSLYLRLREKMFETTYLGKTTLSTWEIYSMCLALIEDSAINEKYAKTNQLCNRSMNFFVNSPIYSFREEQGGDSTMDIAKKIKEQVSKKDFKPTSKESGFYLLGLLLKKMCDKSETGNEKSRLLQPIINTYTISGLNRAVIEKFVEKYAYKIGEQEADTTSLINSVLPFFGELDGGEQIKDYKLWLYAGFFSNLGEGDK